MQLTRIFVVALIVCRTSSALQLQVAVYEAVHEAVHNE